MTLPSSDMVTCHHADVYLHCLPTSTELLLTSPRPSLSERPMSDLYTTAPLL